MKFSVLIAHYNNAEYFKDLHRSLLSQTWINWEAVILDDGSSQEEKNRVRQFIEGDQRFRFFENEQNFGVGKTKAKLPTLATGEICAFVDPDDALKPNAIEILARHYVDQKTTAVYSQFILCDEHMNERKIFPGSEQVRNNDSLFFNVFFEINHFFSFRRDVYEKSGGIEPTLSSSVDQDLYLKIYDLGNVLFVKQPLYLYRQHEKGVSQNAEKKKKLYQNWDLILRNTAKRRNLSKLYGSNIETIGSLPEFLHAKQNTFVKKIKRRLF